MSGVLHDGLLARCSVCHRQLYGYVPRGGDGTLLHVYRHQRYREFSHPPGAFEARAGVWEKCPGSNRPQWLPLVGPGAVSS